MYITYIHAYIPLHDITLPYITLHTHKHTRMHAHTHSKIIARKSSVSCDIHVELALYGTES